MTMQLNRFNWRLMAAAAALTIGALACNSPSAQAPTEAAQLPPAPTTAATEAPVVPATEAAPTGISAAYEGITLTLDPSVATGVSGEVVPAVSGEGGSIPEYRRIFLDGYPGGVGGYYTAQILIFPVDTFRTYGPGNTQIEMLQQILVGHSDQFPDKLPFMPVEDTVRTLRARVGYLDFQNGNGIHYLTGGGFANPITNMNFFYTYQGLTADGKYYVAAILPIAHPSLPPDDGQIPADVQSAASSDFNAYIANLTQQLEAADPASFTPNLDRLDDLIKSLSVQ
jgi:hypothetical protein